MMKNGFEKINDTLNDHFELFEQIQASNKKQREEIDKNKTYFAKSVGEFEKKVLEELTGATKHFSFKAYEESFTKIENDLKDLYKTILELRSDIDNVTETTQSTSADLYDNLNEQ